MLLQGKVGLLAVTYKAVKLNTVKVFHAHEKAGFVVDIRLRPMS